MRNLLFFLVSVVVMANTQAQSFSNQRENTVNNTANTSVINASGRKPKAGDVISGMIRDAKGPITFASVQEMNSSNKVVAFGFTYDNGQFSFTLDNPSDSLVAYCVGYYPAKCQIDGSFYDIFMVRDFQINLDSLLRTADGYTPGEFRIPGHNGFPVLIMDGYEIGSNSTVWKNIDPTKDTYTKEELSILFGISADKIEKFKVYSEDETYRSLGDRGKSGMIEIVTDEYYEKRK